MTCASFLSGSGREAEHAGSLRSAAGAAWRALPGWLMPILGAAMLMWTALVDGRPPVFTDTALYYAQAEYLFEALGWVRPQDAVEPRGDPTALPATPGAPNISASIVRARSAVYGAPLYLLQRLGGLWLAAAVQAFVVAGAIYILYRVACPGAPRAAYLALMTGLATLTPLPFFASWAMPDVFATVMGCTLVALLVYPDRLSRARRLGTAALLAFSMAAHRSNLLDAAVVSLAAVPLLRLGGLRPTRIGRRLLAVATAAMMAVLASMLLELPIQARAGESIGSPPFLSARLLADGPGRVYLRRVCREPQTPFELCRFQDRPMRSSDQVLWSVRRRTAVFLADGPPGRLRMEREDGRFALDAILADPVDEARVAMANSLQQLVEAHVDAPLTDMHYYVRDGYWRRTSLPRILPDAAACLRACPGPLNWVESLALEWIGIASSAAVIVWRLSRSDMRDILLHRATHPEVSRLLMVLALTVILLVANAVVCGALSGPFARYQARVIPLLPMAAGLLSIDRVVQVFSMRRQGLKRHLPRA